MTHRPGDVAGQRECPDCVGTGHVPLGENFVSREMAIDAGDRTLEGQSLGIEYGLCQKCGGDGWIVGFPAHLLGRDE
jgi:hypothetical protein